MKNKKLNCLINFTIVLFALIALTTCRIGLGESVDTQKPTVTISYPQDTSIIRGAFVMQGTAVDETSLKDVTVSFQKKINGEFQAIDINEMKANVDLKTNIWTLWVNKIDPVTNEYPLSDGEYKITVVAEDNAKRVSETSIVYTIDNTPPILIVTQPSTVGANNPWAFGSKLTFTGMQYDENIGDKFSINFFDENNDLIANVTGQNPLPNWELEFDKNTEGFRILEDKMVDKNVPQKYWYDIFVEDMALEYINPNETEEEVAQKTGNRSLWYYSYSKVTELINIGERTPKINEFYQIENNIENLSRDEKFPENITFEKLKELQILREIPEGYVVPEYFANFSINPNNIFPIITIDGLNAANKSTGNQISLSATLRIEIEKGLNNVDINMDSLSYTLWKKNGESFELYSELTDTPTENMKFDPTSIVDGDTKIINFTAPSKKGEYRIQIDARDNDDVALQNNVFDFLINAGAPSIYVRPGNAAEAKVLPVDGKFHIIVEGIDDGTNLNLTVQEIYKDGTKGETLYYYSDDAEGPVGEEDQYGNIIRNSWKWRLSFEAPADGDYKEFIFKVDDLKHVTSEQRKFIVDTTLPTLNELIEPRVKGEGSVAKGKSVISSPILSVEGNTIHEDTDIVQMYLSSDSGVQPDKNSSEWTDMDLSQYDSSTGLKSFSGMITLPNDKGVLIEDEYYLWLRFADDTYDPELDNMGEPIMARTILADNNLPIHRWIYDDESVLEGTKTTDGYDIVQDDFSLTGYYSDSYSELKDLDDEDLRNTEICNTIEQNFDAVKIYDFSWKVSFNGEPVEENFVENDNGKWQFSATEDGRYEIEITIIDWVDNKTTEVIKIFKDNNAPTVNVIDPDVDGSVIINPTPTFTGTAIDSGSGIQSLAISFDDEETWYTSETTPPVIGVSTWKFSVDENFQEGPHTLYVWANDKSNNQVNVNSTETTQGTVPTKENAFKRTFIFDAYAPVFSTESQRYYTNESVNLTGTVSDTYGLNSDALSYVCIHEGVTSEPVSVSLTFTKDGKEATWSVNTPNDLENGTYEYRFTLVDKAGMKSYLSHYIEVDKESPNKNIISAPTENTIGINSINSDSFTFQGTASDDGLGVEKIYYAFTQENNPPSINNNFENYIELIVNNNVRWNIIKEISDGTTISEDKLCEGDWSLYVYAMDKAKNYTLDPAVINFSIDKENPILSSLLNKTSAKKGDEIILSGTVTDSNKVEKIEVEVDGSLYKTITDINETGSWNVALNASQDVTKNYSVTVKAYDCVGKTTVNNLSFYYDVNAPTFDEPSITPLVSLNDENYVNGKIKISGRVNDENKISRVYYSYTDKDSVEQTIEYEKGNNSDLIWNIDISLDTTTLKDNAQTEFVIYAVDAVGNESSYNITLNVNQETDKPVIEITNADINIKEYNSENNTKNVFGTNVNNKIIGTVTDDDSVAKLEVSTDGGTNWKVIADDKKVLTLSFNDDITDANGKALSEGEYTIKFKATDINGTTNEISFWIAVDAGSPIFTNVMPANGGFYSSVINLTGTITDGSGVADIVVVGGGTSSLEKPTSNIVSGVNFTDTITVPNETDKYEKVYTATDKYGQSSTYTFEYNVDKNKPTLEIVTKPVNEYIRKEYNVSFDGTSSDEGNGESGVASVWYYITNEETKPTTIDSNWIQCAGLENWSANISFSEKEEGKYNIYFGVKDKAGNEYIEDAVSIYADDKNPVVSMIANSSTVVNARNITENGIAYRNNSFDLSGYITETYFNSAILSVSKDGSAATVVDFTTGGKNTGVWTYTQNVDTENHTDDGTYLYTIIVTDKAGRETTLSTTVVIDTESPVMEITSITPYVTNNGTNFVNGEITIKGTIFDNDKIESGIYTYNGSEISLAEESGSLNNWTVKIDTTKVADETTLADVLDFVVADRVGNLVNTTEIETYLSNYTIDQSTDLPVVTYTGMKATSEGANWNTIKVGSDYEGNLFGIGNTVIRGTISDDDGINSVKLTIEKDSGEPEEIEIATALKNTVSGAFEFNLNTQENSVYKYPDGKYTVKISVTDINGKANTPVEYNLVIDRAAPSLSITQLSNVLWGSTNPIVITGTFGDAASSATLIATDENIDGKFNERDDSITGVAGITNASWTYTIPVPVNGFTEGDTIKFTATDEAGRTTTSDFVYKIDGIKPTISLDLSDGNTNTTVDNASNRYLSITATQPYLIVKGTANDVGSGENVSGIEKAQWRRSKKENDTYSTWTEWTDIQITGTNGEWSSTIDFFNDVEDAATYQVQFRAVDKAGNTSDVESEQSMVIKIDTSDPTITETAVGETLNSTGVSTFNFAGTVADTNGIASVTYTVSKDNSTAITGKEDISLGSGNWSLTEEWDETNLNAYGFDGSGTGTYEYVFTAKDNSGRTSAITRRISLDATPPTVNITNIMTQLSANGKTNNVNGTITINGTITDNNAVSEGIYKIHVSDNGTDSWSENPIANGSVYNSGVATNYSFDIDTKTYSAYDKKYWRITVTGTDTAGHTHSDSEIVFVDSDTDKPVVTLTNASAEITTEAGVKVDNNLFEPTGNNKLLGTITDDDKISSVKITTKDSTGSSTVAEKTYNPGSATYSLSHELPKAEGVYQISILVTDEGNVTTEVGPFFVAVDAGSPDFVVTSINGAYQNGNFSVSGTVKDVSGIVTISATSNNVESTLINAQTVINETTVVKTWNDEVTLPGSTNLYTITYKATDKYGRESSQDFTFRVDTSSPTLSVIAPADETTTIMKESITAFSGNVSDDGEGQSGVKGVYYIVKPSSETTPTTIDLTTWTVANGVSVWSANIDFSKLEEGVYKVYIGTLDNAGNQSGIIAKTINVDANTPSVNITANESGESGATNLTENNTAYRNRNFTLVGSVTDTYFDSATLSVSKDGSAAQTLTFTTGGNVSGDWTYTQNVNATTHADDGTYLYTITGRDKAGRVSSVSTTVIIDTTSPELSLSNFVDEQVITSSEFTFRGIASDNVGLKGNVKYSSDNNNWTDVTSSGISWSLAMEGLSESAEAKTIYFKVSDKLNNEKVIGPYQYYLDWTAPTLTVTSPTENTTYVKKGDGITLTGTALDAGGMDNVVINVNSTKVATVTEFADTTGEWSVTIPSSSFNQETSASYSLEIIASDKHSGKTTTVTKNLFYDVESPVMNITSISPLVPTNDDNYFVNGTITIQGTISDNDVVSTGTYIYNSGSSTSLGENLNNWKIEIDTTLVADDTTLAEALDFTSTDRAGNSVDTSNLETALASYIVNQASDNPVITLDAMTLIPNSSDRYLLTSNETIGAMISEDDGIASVVANISTGSGTLVTPTTPIVGSTSGRFAQSLSGLAEGEYTITITATDNALGKTTTKAVNIAIDNSNPELIFDLSSGSANFRSNFDLNITSTDTTSVKSIELTEKPDGVTVASSDPSGLNTNTATRKYSIITSENASSPVTLKFTVTDKYGKATTKDFVYAVDLDAPTISFDETSKGTFYIDSASPSKRLTGTANDALSGIDQIRYLVVSKDASQPTVEEVLTNGIVVNGSTTWVANIDMTNNTNSESSYVVYAAIKDIAENTTLIGLEDENPLVTLVIDNANPSAGTVTANPSNSKALYNDDFVISGTAEDSLGLANVTAKLRSTNAELSLTSEAITSGAKSYEWSFAVPVTDEEVFANDGAYEIIVTATDLCGKTATSTFSFTKDNSAPTINFTNIVEDNAVGNPNTNFTDSDIKVLATVTDEIAGLKSYSYKFQKWNGTNYNDASTPLTVTPTSVQTTASLNISMNNILGNNTDGIYRIVMTLTDDAGNTSGEIASSCFRVDQTNPTVAITEPSMNRPVQQNASITIRGNVKDTNGGEFEKIVLKISHITETSVEESFTRTLNADGTITPVVNGETISITDENSDGVYEFEWITLEGADSPIQFADDYTITAVAYDKAGNTRDTTREVSCDNTSPIMHFSHPFTMTVSADKTHSATTQTSEIIGDVTVRGTIDDFSMSEIYYQVGTSSALTITEDNGKIVKVSNTGSAAEVGFTKSTDGVETKEDNGTNKVVGKWKKSTDNYSWDFTFNTLEYVTLAHQTEGTDAETQGNLKTLNVYVVAIDTAGNINVATFPLKLDTDIDKPQAEFAAPETDPSIVTSSFNPMGENNAAAKIGGAFIVSGIATDDNFVHSVYMQVELVGGNYDVNGVLRSSTDPDTTWSGSTASGGQTYADVLAGSGTTEKYFTKIGDSDDAWYKVTGTNSWKYTLNRANEFTLSDLSDYLTADYKKGKNLANEPAEIVVRVKVLDTKVSGRLSTEELDGEGKASRFGLMYELPIYIDAGAPGIVLNTFPEQNSYQGGTVPISFDITDDSSVSAFTLTANDTTVLTEAGLDGWTIDKSDDKKWTVSGNLTVTNYGTNKITLAIQASDGTKTSSVSRSFVVDIQPPTATKVDGSYLLKAETDNGLSERMSYGGKNLLKIFTGSVNVAGKIADEADGSGLDKVILYITGFPGEENQNIMYNTVTGEAVDLEPEEPEGAEGTQWSWSWSMPNESWTTDNDQKVEKYFPFANVKDGLILKSDPATAYMVIDRAEGGNEDATNANKDGDGYGENIKTDGDWYVKFDTTKLPDGVYTINYITVDKSGNSRYYEDYAVVTNNAPIITSVVLGTDLNNDGNVETKVDGSAGFEDEKYLPADFESTKDFNVRNNKFVIRVNAIQGTGTLKYYLRYKNASGVEVTTDSSADGYNNGVFTITDFPASDPVETWDYTIWVYDSMAVPLSSGETTISVTLDNVDNTPPVGQFKELTVDVEESATANEKSGGLFKVNNIVQGHIEPRANSKHNGDRTTPDLSGNVILRGEAYDNQQISKIVLTLDGTEVVLAQNEDGMLTAQPDAITDQLDATLHVNELTQAGHFVEWSYNWNTAEKIIAKNDVVVKVVVYDNAEVEVVVDDNKATKPNSSVEITYETTETENTARTEENQFAADGYGYNSMKVDVVPYVVKLETGLSILNKRNPSEFDRSALGHYPINSNETFKVHGFNLKGAPENGGTTVNGGTTGITSYAKKDDASLTYDYVDVVASNLTSGELEMEVNGIEIINNINDNSLESNCLPNGVNNDLLTDDMKVVIWEFDSDAVIPKSGKIEQPIMKINPVSDAVGFAFVNGPLYFSMGDNNYSYRFWCGSYDFFTSVGFTYDKEGNSYGVAAGGDINENQADKFNFFTSRWGRSGRTKDGSYDAANALRLESIGQIVDTVKTFDKQRIKSPALATAVHGDATNIYLAYYDAMNAEIRFKYGSINSNSKGTFGQFTDQDQNRAVPAYNSQNVQVVAKEGGTNKPGIYVSLAVYSKEEADTVDDVVVMCWYDQTNRQLKYMYNTTPTSIRNGLSTEGWSEAKTIFSSDSDMANAGEYCKVVVDNDGGIHIAAYDPVNLDLCYAYAESYASDFSTCVVDSNGVTGSNLTLDVAKVGNNWIPYIGYYATSCIKPKYAYKVDITSNAPNGSVNQLFTGKWESMIVPTNSVIEMQSNQHNDINIAVWKNEDGEIKEPETTKTTGDNSHTVNNNGYNADAYGYVYGNGTSNPIMGYAIISGASSNTIETAQIKSPKEASN